MTIRIVLAKVLFAVATALSSTHIQCPTCASTNACCRCDCLLWFCDECITPHTRTCPSFQATLTPVLGIDMIVAEPPPAAVTPHMDIGDNDNDNGSDQILTCLDCGAVLSGDEWELQKHQSNCCGYNKLIDYLQ